MQTHYTQNISLHGNILKATRHDTEITSQLETRHYTEIILIIINKHEMTRKEQRPRKVVHGSGRIAGTQLKHGKPKHDTGHA